MIRTASALVAAAAFTTIALLPSGNSAALPAALAQSSQGSYAVDAVHSSVQFELGYWQGVAISTGRFNEFTGAFNFDSDNPSASTLNFSINAASIDTNNEGRDRHLRSPDFFNTGRFSSITFESKQIRKQGDTFKVTGDITLLGETKEITVDVTKVGEGSGRGGEPVQGISSEFTIKRSDFGMDFYVDNGALGDDVTVIVHAYGIQN